MADWFPLSGPTSPVRTSMVYTPAQTNSREGGEIVIVSEQDATAIIEANRRDREIDQRKRTFEHVARIPAAVWNMMVREGWQHDTKRVERWLDENPAFRIRGGR